MSSYVITCPACKQRYRVSNIPASPKPFVCKKCGYTTALSNLLPAQPITMTGDATPAPATAPTPATPVPRSTKPAGTKRVGGGLEVKAYLTVAGNGTKLVLTPGVYILGRKSSDSMASLQIAPDISMSRQHARLTVRQVGGKVMAQVIGLKAENPVIINDKILPAGQPYTLKVGDCMRLGATRVIYSI